MRNIKMLKTELLNIVRDNKKKHVQEYEEAIQDYKTGVLKVAEENLKRAKTGDLDSFKKIEAQPPAPLSYEKEYGRAIRQLELSIDTEIVIEEDIFNQLVLDEWDWKSHFSATNSFLKSYTVGSHH